MEIWVNGVDTSIYQGIMKPEMTKAQGTRVAIVRIGIGLLKDVLFPVNFPAFKDAGIDLVGAYYVFHPQQNSLACAKFCNELMKPYAIDIPLMIDVEIEANISQFAYAFRVRTLCVELRKFLGNRKIGIYTRGEFWNRRLGLYAKGYDWSEYMLWIARYNSSINHPWNDDIRCKPIGFSDYAIWQWSADGNGLGYVYGAKSRSIDLNRVKLGFYSYWKTRKVCGKIWKPVGTVGSNVLSVPIVTN